MKGPTVLRSLRSPVGLFLHSFGVEQGLLGLPSPYQVQEVVRNLQAYCFIEISKPESPSQVQSSLSWLRAGSDLAIARLPAATLR